MEFKVDVIPYTRGYEGEWKDDFQHGKEKEVKADGSSYNGEFKMGKKHGSTLVRKPYWINNKRKY